MITHLLLAALLSAAHPAAADKPLDQKGIHHAYNDGNFDLVTRDIEAFQKTHATYSQSDSVFIAKHLAVVYSANPATREKGKYYMYRLLELLPSAKLIDMYVSDEIDRLFDKVKEEFMVRQRDFGLDTTALAMPERAPANRKEPEPAPARPAAKPPGAAEAESERARSHKTAWIVAGLGAATVGLAAVYFLAASEPEKEDQVYDIP